MGALTIESPFGKVTWLKGKKPDGYEMLTRRIVDGHPVWTIPEGMHAHIRVMGKKYIVNNYRERGGHDHGGRIEGNGDPISLDRDHKSYAIDSVVFRFIPKEDSTIQKKTSRRSILLPWT